MIRARRSGYGAQLCSNTPENTPNASPRLYMPNPSDTAQGRMSRSAAAGKAAPLRSVK
jgi:hypothetical protein